MPRPRDIYLKALTEQGKNGSGGAVAEGVWGVRRADELDETNPNNESEDARWRPPTMGRVLRGDHRKSGRPLGGRNRRFCLRNRPGDHSDRRVVGYGATLLSVPTRLIQQLGLKKNGSSGCQQHGVGGRGHVRRGTGDDPGSVNARWTSWRSRRCPGDHRPDPARTPGLVVDLRNRVLTGNPAHVGNVTKLY